MLKIETVFANKVIICGVPEKELNNFVEFFIKYMWTHSKLPASSRFVKEAENPTIEKLPSTFNLKEVAANAIKRGALILENLGPVYLGLNCRITKNAMAVNPDIRIEIDKFIFERDDRKKDLKLVVLDLVKEWNKEVSNNG